MLSRLRTFASAIILAAGLAATVRPCMAQKAAAEPAHVDAYSAASRFIPGVPVFRDDPRPVISIAIADTLVNPYDILSLRQTIRSLAGLLPNYRLHTITITAAEAGEALASARPYFLFAPAGFVAIANREYKLNFSRIATRVTDTAADPEHAVGSVFLVRKNNPAETLADLKGKSACAGLPDAVDAWLAALGEIHAAGFDETAFFKTVSHSNNAYPDVVSALLSGKTDVGVLPACLLETLEQRHLADTENLKVINAQDNGLSCRHSTALYPDLSLLALTYAPEDVVRDMTIAILQLRENARVKWLTNVGHGEVVALYQKLAAGPYRYLRETTLTGLLSRYRTEAFTVLVVILLLIANEWRLHKLVRRRTEALKRSMNEQQRIKEEAAQSRLQLALFERRSLVQQMSGMIAHEINAPVGAIRSYAAVLKMQSSGGKTPETGVLQKVLANVDHEAARIAGIIARVRAYAKSSMPAQAPCDLCVIIRKSICALEAERPDGKRPRITFSPATKSAAVLGNALELEILFLNLLRNAANALAVDGLPEGRISCALFMNVENGRWKTAITNHGQMVSNDVIEHLNNKSAAVAADASAFGGLGLGLTICRGIADSHGASLRYERGAAGGVSALVEIEPLSQKKNKENAS